MIRETFPVGLLSCNCSILGDEVSREAIVVDPGYDIPRIVALLAKHKMTVSKILVTHAHIDHIASAIELKRITGAPILYSQADLPLVAMMDQQAAMFGLPVPTVLPPDHSPADGEVVEVGGIQANVLCAERASTAGWGHIVCGWRGANRFSRWQYRQVACEYP
jgi:hydroxyacylglutathione hydrolase